MNNVSGISCTRIANGVFHVRLHNQGDVGYTSKSSWMTYALGLAGAVCAYLINLNFYANKGASFPPWSLMARIFQLCSPCPQLPSAKPLRRGLGAKCQRRVNHFIVRTHFIAWGTLAFPNLYPHFVPLKVQFKSVCYKTQQAQPKPKPFMSNWLWISPWMKSISYKSDVTFY